MSTTGPSSDRVWLDACAIAILTRSVPGLVSLCLSWSAHSGLAAGTLVLAVWSDVLAGWIARRKGWTRQAFHTQLEGFVDFTCFIWAPVQLLLTVDSEILIWIAAAIFTLAGMFRIARFNTEGLVNGRYRGLPVTYNGYLIPLTVLGTHYLDARYSAQLCAGVMLIVSALMVSSRLTVPEL